MENTPKITKITLDGTQYDIDLPSDASPVIDSLEVTRKLVVPEITDSKANNEAANKGYVDTKDAYLQEQINTIEARSDVVDVVGTKAELDNYDASKLSKDDVVKVLADESLNNAITYYRWSANAWSLIGQIGPYVLIKTNTGNKVYIHNDATQADLAYTKDATVNTLVERTTNGNINLPDSSKINNDSYATSKKYVDNAVKIVNDNLTGHINDKNNPHEVNQSQIGLSNVVNTGDSNTPVSGGTTKFTTGGAFTLKTDIETKINNLKTELEAQFNNLSSGQIPSLDASKITSGTFSDERIASAEAWNTQITTLNESVATNTSQLTKLETSVTSINTEIDSLKNTIGDISNLLDKINGEVI